MSNTPQLSFEFFPPKTPKGRENLLAARDKLAAVNPEYFSVTYGAGGSTRDNTKDIVLQIHQDGFAVAPHLSFGGDTEEAVLSLLEEYRNAGIKHLVALRGDMPSGMGYTRLVNANELVALVRHHFGSHFDIKVAAYPEIHPDAENYDKDIFWLTEKFRAGADSALTQYFYNAEAYFHFMECCEKRGIDKPVYPGIMPITNFKNLVRFSDNCGADIPRWLRQRLTAFGDDEQAVTDFGIEVVTRLCERLMEGGAPGFHFYTMNKAEVTLRILANLGVKS